MARNRKVFEEAVRAGANAAWDKNWDQAVEAYQRALAEFPNDAGALAGLGLAYAGTDQWETALKYYQEASALAPDDPVLHERIGRTREQLGHREKAAEAYLASADRYLSQQQAPHLALERWQDAIRAYPDCLKAYAKLLQYHQQHSQTREAMDACLAMARIYQAQGQPEYAIRVCNYALKLAPHDPQVLAALDDLRYRQQTAVEPEADVSQVAPELLPGIGETISSTVFDFEFTSATEAKPERGSPIEITRQKALEDLAESFFEEETSAPSAIASPLSKAEIDTLIGRAIDLHTRGKTEDAIAAYEHVLQAKVDRPAIRFNLGLLYQEKTRFDAAISQFESAVSHANYALGSHFALGECYRAQGRIDEALGHFVEVLKSVDIATVRRDRADDLHQLYDNLANRYSGKGKREQAMEFTNALVEFFSQEGWESKVVEARQRLDTLAQEGPALSLADMLAIPESERVLESISLAQEYANRNMSYAALEECYYGLGLAPTYLPIHRQIAQILVAMEKINEAVSKFVAIADTYQMRGSVHSAMAMYHYALKLTPMDREVRTKLIDLLIINGEIDQALEHYLSLANTYYQMAQIDQARETYQEALKLAPRGAPDQEWEVRILHRIGDIHMQRVDWRRAIAVYEKIRKLAPNDARARSTLMDLYYRFDQPEQALAELDGLVKIYRDSGKLERLFDTLEDLVRERPDDIALRTRLAQIHLDAGNAERALEHLDRLGDLQLEAGRYEDARATIRAIIALQPPNVAAYEQLLDQISERGSS